MTPKEWPFIKECQESRTHLNTFLPSSVAKDVTGERWTLTGKKKKKEKKKEVRHFLKIDKYVNIWKNKVKNNTVDDAIKSSED